MEDATPHACVMRIHWPGAIQTSDRTKSPLANGDFREGLAGWERTTYGAEPRVAVDSHEAHGSGRSLQIEADAPTDTAFGQEVRLMPGRLYRLSGWVRTRSLDPRGSSTCGTLQVQLPHGAGVLARGVNHGGSTEWTHETILFSPPADGRVRVCAFIVGFGRGVGAAWFSDLRIEPVDTSRAVLRVTREPLCPGRISPLQYGQFIEYLCDLVPAMWAEKLYDGSFEGLTPYTMAFLKQADFKEKNWYPSGQVNRATYSLDRETKVSGSSSQRIAVDGDTPCTVGISQDGVAVQAGVPLRFHIWLKRSGGHGPVHVSLNREGRIHAAADLEPGDGWKRFTVRLVPDGTDAAATFSVEFHGPGTLWLDNASLMSEQTVGGWRSEVVEALKALKPGIIRFGGSTLDDPNLGAFEWRDTVGDPDRRKPFRAWGGLQPTGPGLEELVQLIRAAGAEPLICVRYHGKTPKDAAEEVEYFNGAPETPMGALRARNGHPKPYRIRYWQIGNEIGDERYARDLPAWCEAMRAVDPGIKLLSSFPTPERVRAGARLLKYVCPHQYSPDLAGMEQELDEVRRMIAGNAPGRDIRIGITEWNTTAGDWGPRRAMLWTLSNALACSRYHNMLHRHADIVAIANRSNLTNSFCSGIIQTDNRRMYLTPTYYAQQLYSTHAGTRPLRIESDIPVNVGLDVSATLSEDGRKVTLFAVNDTVTAVTRPLDLSAFGAAPQDLSVDVLGDTRHAGEPDANNSFADPARIRPVHQKFHARGARFEYTFPPLTLTVLRWRAGK